ncbi:MAG: DNA repair protein RadC [Planctomyces sp.]|nr:DNA repair protein RadC [Planctomyces sp.]
MNRNMMNRSAMELIAEASGRRGASAYADAYKLIEKVGLNRLAEMGAGEILELCRGMSIDSIQRLQAGIEIGLRISEMRSDYEEPPRITSPAVAKEFCRTRFSRLAREGRQEEFWVVTLNTKNVPIECHQVTVGTLRNSLVHPREVFRVAIRDAANCILVLHNHPSGDPTPSDQDIEVTKRLEEAANIIGIPVIDHIVVAGESAISIQEWQSGTRCE